MIHKKDFSVLNLLWEKHGIMKKMNSRILLVTTIKDVAARAVVVRKMQSLSRRETSLWQSVSGDEQ